MTPEIQRSTPDHLVALAVGGCAEHQRTLAIVQAHEDPVGMLWEASRTILVKAAPIGMFGVWPMWPGVGRAWSMISPEAKSDFPCSLYKGVKRNLEIIIARDQLVRVEAVVKAGHPTAHPWIRRLGFRREGLMRNYGIGGVGDYHLYARISWAHLN